MTFEDYDPLEEWIQFDVFQTLSDKHIQCLVCDLGLLIPVDSEPNIELVGDICNAVFKIKIEGE